MAGKDSQSKASAKKIESTPSSPPRQQPRQRKQHQKQPSKLEPRKKSNKRRTRRFRKPRTKTKSKSKIQWLTKKLFSKDENRSFSIRSKVVSTTSIIDRKSLFGSGGRRIPIPEHEKVHPDRKLFSDKYNNLDDLLCIAIVCQQHQRLALIPIPHQDDLLFFPFVRFRLEKYSLNSLVRDMLIRIFGTSGNAKFHKLGLTVDRLQTPKTNEFRQRFIYQIEVSTIPKSTKPDSKMKCVCETKYRIRTEWLGFQEICQRLSSKNCDLLGPEPKHFFEERTKAKRKPKSKSKFKLLKSKYKPAQSKVVSKRAASSLEQRPKSKHRSKLSPRKSLPTWFKSNKSRIQPSLPLPPPIVSSTRTVPLVWNEITINDYIRDYRRSEEHEMEQNMDKKSIRYILDHLINCSCTSVWLSQEEIIGIYNEFLLQCNPSYYMVLRTFEKFMDKILIIQRPINIQNFSQQSKKNYFNAFDYNGRSYLGFGDLLLGLMCCGHRFQCCKEPKNCPCVRSKHEFIFSFYTNMKPTLDRNDLLAMIQDYQRKRSLMVKNRMTFLPKYVQIQPEELANNEQNSSHERLTFERFFYLAYQDELFASIGVNLKVEEFFDFCLRLEPDFKHLVLPQWIPANKFKPSQWVALNYAAHDRKCLQCRNTKFYLCSFMATLSTDGDIQEVHRLDAKSSEGLSVKGLLKKSKKPKGFEAFQHRFRPDMKEDSIQMLAYDLINRINKFAAFMFHLDEEELTGVMDETSVSFEKDRKTLPNWFYENKTELIKDLKKITKKAREILSQESRVLEITNPCFVMGDIHGYLRDLVLFSTNLWKSSPFLNNSNYLFLGDYVDRGPYGVECVMYLFCLKILAPQNFLLLRGNHEIREVQEQFSFQEECNLRFNLDLWESINKAFDELPIVALIDSRIYCAHGGIPQTLTSVRQINMVQNPLPNPIDSSFETWEILWNDPISTAEVTGRTVFEPTKSSEVKPYNRVAQKVTSLRNIKRGTGFLFSETDVNRFCEKNQLDFVLRAHEVFDDGFHFHHSGKTITIFSTSNYSEMANRSSVVLVDRQKIRVIQSMNDEE